MSSSVSLGQSFHPGKKSVVAVAAFIAVLSASQAFANTGIPAATVVSQSASGNFSSDAIGDAVVNRTFAPITTGTISENNNLFGSEGSYAYSSLFVEATGPNYGGANYVAGIANSTSVLHKEFTFRINTAGNYSLDTLINSGYVGSFRNFFAFGQGSASYDWKLSINGAVVKSTSATFTQGLDYGTTVETGGNVELNSFSTRYRQATWDATNVFTDIGYRAADSFVTVAFDLTTSVSASYYINPFYISSYGSCLASFTAVINPILGEGQVNGCGSSTVSFSDPTFINGPGANQAFLGGIPTLTEVSAVPEPSEWMLLLSGMAVVGAIAKRRRLKSL